MLFNEMDLDMSGALSVDELGRLLSKAYSTTLSEEQLTALAGPSGIDRSGDGEITMDELVNALGTLPELQILGQVFSWRQAFDKFDVDGAGFVDSEEVLPLVRAAETKLTEGDVDYIKSLVRAASSAAPLTTGQSTCPSWRLIGRAIYA